MPLITIRLVKEVIAADPAGKKADIAKAVTAAVTAATGVADSDVWILFEEVEARNWYLGPNDVKRLRFKS